MIGQIFTHLHIEKFTIEIVAETAKGYKVSQTEIIGRKKPKAKTAFYNLADIIGDRALFTHKA